jgi:hypothetical protein
VERSAGIHDAQLDVPPIPEGFECWYRRFLDIRTGEGLTYADVAAYSKVSGVDLSPVEVTALFEMNKAASAVISEITKENMG